MSTQIAIPVGSSGFQEDKELARRLRQDILLPALDRGEDVVLDFSRVGYATQSFIHALVGGALQQHGESVLDRIAFHHCSAQLKNVIELVVNYSLEGFTELAEVAEQDGP